MKTGKILGCLLLLCATVFLFKSGSTAPSMQKSTLSVPSTEIAATLQLGQLLKEPRKNESGFSSLKNATPSACDNFFQSLAKLDLSGRFRPLFFQDVPSPEGDCNLDALGLKKLATAFQKNCFPKNQNLSEEISHDCETNIYSLRAAATRISLQNEPLDNISDLHSLTDLLFAELSGFFDENSLPDYARIRAVSERILTLNPNIYTAAKVGAVSNVLEALSDPSLGENHKEEAWNRASAALEQVRRLQPKDGTMDDLEIVVRTQGLKPERGMALSKVMAERDPNNPRTWYLMAYSEWIQNQRHDSALHLKMAMDLDPSNPSYQEEWKSIHRPRATIDAFKGNFNIQISAADIAN